MNPLVMIAASILPEILKSIAGGATPGGANDVVAAVTKAVTDAAGTADPAAAKEKIASDPAASDSLKIKLAEIAAQQEDNKRAAYFAEIKASLDAETQKRADELQRIRDDFANAQKTRQSILEFSKSCPWSSCTGFVVSLIVTLGFFIVTFWILIGSGSMPDEESHSWQIINMVIGALITAFATVVNFWLGSSQGSREKDAANFQIAQQNAENVKQANDNANAAIRGQPPSPNDGKTPKTKSPNFNRCLDLVLKQEGGFSNNPNDPGRATNLGITEATLAHFRGAAVTIEDVRSLTKDEAAEIYRANYWNTLRCDDLPRGLDLAVFDFGVNSGPGRAAKTLQNTAGAKDDGSVGPSTLGAIKANNAAELIRLYSQHRLEFLQSLPTFATFGRGWTRRVNEIEKAATDMAAEGATS